MFQILCIQFKIVSIPYFLDEMQLYEALEVLNALPYHNREEWEQTRLLMWLTAQVNSTKKIQAKDILTFAWDKEENNNTVLSNIDKKKLQDKAKLFSTKLNLINNE